MDDSTNALIFNLKKYIFLLLSISSLLCGPPPQEGAAYCVALCLSVRLSVRPVRGSFVIVYITTVLRAKHPKQKKLRFSIIGQRQPCGHVVCFVLFTFQGRIKYGDQPHNLVLRIINSCLLGSPHINIKPAYYKRQLKPTKDPLKVLKCRKKYKHTSVLMNHVQHKLN